MNRPIKFVAWDKEEKEWLKGSPDGLLSVALGFPKAIDLYQFTGLLDKDGKELYEGHIVEWSGTKTEILWDEDCPGYIFGNAIPGQHGMDCLDEDTVKTMTIIGHIAEKEQTK